MGVWSTRAPLPLAAAARRVPRPCCHSRGLVEGSKSWQLCAHPWCGSTAMYNNARILGGPYVQSKHDWSERAGKHKATPERMREGEREGLRPRCGSEIESWSESRSELTGKQGSHRARERKAELTMNVRAAKEHDETVGESKMKQRQHEKIWQGRRPQRETLCP